MNRSNWSRLPIETVRYFPSPHLAKTGAKLLGGPPAKQQREHTFFPPRLRTASWSPSKTHTKTSILAFGFCLEVGDGAFVRALLLLFSCFSRCSPASQMKTQHDMTNHKGSHALPDVAPFSVVVLVLVSFAVVVTFSGQTARQIHLWWVRAVGPPCCISPLFQAPLPGTSHLRMAGPDSFPAEFL